MSAFDLLFIFLVLASIGAECRGVRLGGLFVSETDDDSDSVTTTQ